LRGDAKRIQLATLVNITPSAIALGLATAEEIDRIAYVLAAHADREDTYITTARIIQVWGRRPPAA
jgi:hypothetical protein